MSTKISLIYDDILDVHIYQDCFEKEYYLSTPEGTVLIPKKMAERLKKLIGEKE